MAKGDGLIVNVSPGMGARGLIGESNYSASKGVVNAFTRCTAFQSGRFGIRVNAVLPGLATTDLVTNLAEGSTGKAIATQITMRQFGYVYLIAQVVRFPDGPESAYLTGSLVPVEGGAMAAPGLGRPS